MNNSLWILYWNCQGIGNKRLEHTLLTNQLKIDILLLNETHLHHQKIFSTPNFHTYTNNRISTKQSNGGGTAILIHHNITHSSKYINTTSIENTAILIQYNGQGIRLSAVYKSPGSTLLHTDLDSLLNTNTCVIVAKDLNAKHPVWHSNTTTQLD